MSISRCLAGAHAAGGQPVVKGELKIPGFSEYLHPISATQLIGVGYDAATVGGRTVTTGVKLSLFDVADPTRPLELDYIVEGARGSWSMATREHKALLFHQPSGLLALPMQVREVSSAAAQGKQPDEASSIPYGDEVRSCWIALLPSSRVTASSTEATEKRVTCRRHGVGGSALGRALAGSVDR